MCRGDGRNVWNYTYCCLKNSVEDTHNHDEKAEDDEEAEETRQEHRVEPKQKRPKTQIPDIDFQH